MDLLYKNILMSLQSFPFPWRLMGYTIIQNFAEEQLIEKCIANRKPCHQLTNCTMYFQKNKNILVS